MRIPSGFLILLLLAFVYVTATALQGDTGKTAVSAAQAALWVLVMLFCANLTAYERKTLLRLGLVVLVGQVSIAILESVLMSEWIRSNVAAAVDRGHPYRVNLILGAPYSRAQGTFGYPIAFGHFSAAGALTCGILAIQRRSGLAALGVIVGLGGVLCSGTRSALLALVVAFLTYVLLMLSSKSVSRRLVIYVLGAGACLLLITVVADGLYSKDVSVLHRLGVVQSLGRFQSLDITQILFGSGYNSHEVLFRTAIIANKGTYAVDNAFITFLITSGLIGTVLFLTLLAAAWRHGSSALRAMLVLFIIMGTSYDMQNWHASAFLLFAIIGTACSSSTASANLKQRVAL